MHAITSVEEAEFGGLGLFESNMKERAPAISLWRVSNLNCDDVSIRFG